MSAAEIRIANTAAGLQALRTVLEGYAYSETTEKALAFLAQVERHVAADEVIAERRVEELLTKLDTARKQSDVHARYRRRLHTTAQEFLGDDTSRPSEALRMAIAASREDYDRREARRAAR